MGIRTAAQDEGRRRPTNLSINDDVIKAARAHGLNVSRIAETALIEAIRQKEREAWRAENAEAIAYQNGIVAQEGAFGDDVRLF